MLTKMNTGDLMKVGCRVPSDRLLDQVDRTLKIASKEAKDIQELLPKGFLEDVKKVQAELKAARSDSSIREREREEIARFETKAFREGKVWRRQVAHRAQRALHLGRPVDGALTNVNPAFTENALAAEVNRMIDLLERHKESLPGQNVEKLIQRGRNVAETLSPSYLQKLDSRLSETPEPVKKFYAQKGDLYLALKAINDAGRELHADDPTAAASYDTEMIYPQTN